MGLDMPFRTTDVVTRTYSMEQRLPGSQLVKKFPAFYGTRRSIIAFTTTRHLSLS